MKIVYTKHVKDKLQEKEHKKLGIIKETLIKTLDNPIVVDKIADPHQSIGRLTDELSLSVIWKIEKGVKKVITFYPAGKGRYESKILQRR